MRIAYQNPWVNCSENQGFMSMAEAGRRMGIELIACSNENDINACKPDFVLSVASSMAKIADYPTYLTVHEPKTVLIEQPIHFRSIFSYDGYLAVSDSLVRFIKDFCFGAGRNEDPGFVYLTPQLNDHRADWVSSNLKDRLRVVYFGTNWCFPRMPQLFKTLDTMNIMNIHGPEESWDSDDYASYRGPVPFDGAGPQRIYAECGIGLAIMDERWQREDVISNRIFEISSVGAVSICADIPWTRKWFGDAVLYFNPLLPAEESAAQVMAHYKFCLANPDQARQMGEKARRIFETHFSAEKMLSNLVAYHQRKTAERERLLTIMAPAPRISVVLRCGGRSLEIVRRAVDSIRRQTFGSFTVILAKYQDLDLTEITTDLSGAIAEFDEFLIPDGRRGEMLFKGVARVQSPYFAVLDDDDFWMSDHFETLFRAGRRVREDFDMAFSGIIGFDFEIKHSITLSLTRNVFKFGFENEVRDPIEILNWICIGSFVARTDLLSAQMHLAPDMNTAEDALLICLLAWRSKPIFSFRPTAFYRRDAADGSDWRNDPQRVEDEISLGLRAGLSYAPVWLSSSSLNLPNRIWSVAKPGLEAGGNAATLHKLLPLEVKVMQPLWNESQKLIAAETQLSAIQASTSWRITAPLRGLVRFSRRIRRKRIMA